jgi:hypothetical protein
MRAVVANCIPLAVQRYPSWVATFAAYHYFPHSHYCNIVQCVNAAGEDVDKVFGKVMCIWSFGEDGLLGNRKKIQGQNTTVFIDDHDRFISGLNHRRLMIIALLDNVA